MIRMNCTYNVERNGTIDLKVEVVGELIATIDNRRVAGRETSRWQELTLYRLMRGGYLLQMEELTTREGEREFFGAVICADPKDVLAALRDDDDDEEALIDVGLAYELLKLAAQRHVSFREIWDEIASLNPWGCDVEF